MEAIVPIIKAVFPWVGGLISGIAIVIFNNRRPLLSYGVTHERIGMTAEDQVHGKVEVTYRGTVVSNLYLSTITLANRSIKDLIDLELKAWTRDGCFLLSETSLIEGTIEPVHYTDDYTLRLQEQAAFEKEANESEPVTDETKKKLDENGKFQLSQRWYKVPALNRGQSLTLTYLVSADPNTSPWISMSCQTAGVRLREKRSIPPITSLWGVPIVEAALVGVVFAILIYGITINYVTTLWLAALICIVTGILSNVPGALTVRAYRWLREYVVG